jgi:class 3 adenylate cyclase
VNVASRLQSTAEPDSIQISGHVYEVANDTDFGIDIEYKKREVFLKNLGSRTTYVISLQTQPT